AGLIFAAAEPTRAATVARRSSDTAPPLSLFEKPCNVDELHVIHAAERLCRMGADGRILLVPPDGPTPRADAALADSAASVEAGGATVIGSGIGDHTVDLAYSRHRVVDRPDQLARAMIDGTRLALRRSLGLSGMDTWWLRASGYEEERVA